MASSTPHSAAAIAADEPSIPTMIGFTILPTPFDR